MKIGFDHEKYLEEQSKYILERVNNYDKLYLEFGGKLLFDLHAKRVLPGFDENAKIKLLHKLRENVEVVICVYAGDIERNKIRGDFGITYDMDVMRLIDDLRSYDLEVNSVVITRYNDQPSATVFINKLERRGIKVYKHRATKGYPTDVDTIVSDEGYGKNPYIETSKPIVVVTAPGPGSGKMATCLSQLYHEHKRGINAGYAKFETFPIWNIPLRHPVNLAYEAATADLNDVNMIDSFHLEAYGETTVNYNRDLEIFPVVNAMFELISGKSPYKSPTDMGVNMAGNCIFDDEACCKASKQEIIRRYYQALCEKRRTGSTKNNISKLEILMKQAEITPQDREVAVVALNKEKETDNKPAVAIELPDGKIVTGRTTDLLGASAAALLNALKALGNIDDEVELIEKEAIEPIQTLKTNYLGSKNPRLHTDEILIALSSTAAHNENAKKAMGELTKLKGCDAHSTVLLSSVDETTFKKLGMQLTCEPKYEEDGRKYHKH